MQAVWFIVCAGPHNTTSLTTDYGACACYATTLRALLPKTGPGSEHIWRQINNQSGDESVDAFTSIYYHNSTPVKLYFDVNVVMT